jgi:hypothetical protein
MLEKQLRESNHTKKQGFVSRSSLPTKERLHLRWGDCKGQFPRQAGSLSTTFLLSTKGIFSTKRQDRSPYKLPTAHHNLGSYPATPSRLGGKPPRVTNTSKLVDVKPKCSSYGNALVSSQGRSWAHSLNPTPRIWLKSTNLTNRGLGRATKAWSLLEIDWDFYNSTRNSNLQLKKARGIYTPSKEKLAVGPQ